MKLISKIASALLIGGSVALSTLPASAAPLPAVYSQGWSQHSVKPVWIRLGAGGSVMAHTWSWSSWTASKAQSTGTLWVNNCTPNCAKGKYSYHKIIVGLSAVKNHGSTPYFSQMTWNTPGYHVTGSPAGNTVTMFYLTLPGASIPGWLSCFPLSSKKTCYEPGQFCPSGDHKLTGLAGDGKFITCRNVNGWRWEA